MAGASFIAGLAVTVAAAVLAGCAPAHAPAGASPGQTSPGQTSPGQASPGQTSTAEAGSRHNGPAEVVRGRAADGTVTGRFVREGGPVRPGGQQPAVVPLAGTVTFRATSGDWLRRVRVGKSGRFSVALPPGRFAVSGRSPAIIQVTSGSTVGPGGQVTGGTRSDPPCSAPLTVRVIAGHTTAARLVCPVP